MRNPVRSPSMRQRSPRSPAQSPTALAAALAAAEPGHFRKYVAALLLLAAVVLSCTVLYHAAVPIVSYPASNRSASADTLVSYAVEDQIDRTDLDHEVTPLYRILNDAAMENSTVILTTLNAAWAAPNSIIDLFISSFRMGYGTRRLLDHLVIVALDQKAYARCISIHFHCFLLPTEGVDFSEEEHFMSAGYLSLMWRRIAFLQEVLEMGYNFIFTDADVMWFRDPLPHFYPDGDFQIACDHFKGNATGLENIPNGGFIYVKSSNRTIEFYKFWYSSRERYPGYHDQDVLNFIKRESFFDNIGLRLRFLSTAFFGGICEPSRDMSQVCTMHANCCIGLSSKINDLKVMLRDWRIFMSLPPIVKRSRQFSWRLPQNCSLASLQS